MEAYQERVVQEQADLKEKITRLAKFVAQSPLFSTLPDEERQLLNQQLDIMGQYQWVLEQRIARFPQIQTEPQD